VFGIARLLCGLDDYLHGAELWVSAGEGREALLTAARRAYAPSLMVAGDWAGSAITEGKSTAADGRAQAYVCRGQTCSAPVTDPESLAELLTADNE
jgi:hypothetical protein